MPDVLQFDQEQESNIIFPDLVNVPAEIQVNELSLDDILDKINSEEFQQKKEGLLPPTIYEGTAWYNSINLFKDALPIELNVLLDSFIDNILIGYQHVLNINMAQPDVDEDYDIFMNRVREFRLILHTINNILILIEYYNPQHYIQMKQFLKLIETQEQDFDITRIIEILTEIKTYL